MVFRAMISTRLNLEEASDRVTYYLKDGPN